MAQEQFDRAADRLRLNPNVREVPVNCVAS